MICHIDDDDLQVNARAHLFTGKHPIWITNCTSQLMLTMNIILTRPSTTTFYPTVSGAFIIHFTHSIESPKLRNTNNSRNLKDERDPGKTKWWRNCNRVAGRLRNLSGKVSHKVKTFFSRPVREPATRKLISRIEARRRAQNDNNRTRRESRSGQRAFSRPRNRSLERLRNGPDQSVAEENCSNREESAELVNDNGNAVIVNGLPYWITADDPLLIDQ
ncbi:hypothetical protein KIN20_017209, partial [Parelaphostrongylus tenuis]